ncbi:EamA-like transporter family protein [Pseudomonas orientalis]|uniref:EamA-like transporter family protein n=2 Tax=Pseudomonas orientalis TaxID=76758 RepID=A0A1H2DW92_9PSED|nr:membrane protein [Pseudomonas orientalis]SDT87106.1 EamA-like transporter family protein [Pseudomonas orientalis]
MSTKPTTRQVVLLTGLAMLAFAANSVLCRLALRHTEIDPATFTLIRLFSGAMMLWLIMAIKNRTERPAGTWLGGFTLFIYAFAFSYAYLHLETGSGALLLFGAVQLTMLGFGYWRGERMQGVAIAGLALAIGGLIALLLPGASAPAPGSAAIMLLSGVAWAAYSLIGKRAHDPLASTTGNFLRAVPMMLGAAIVFIADASIDIQGVLCAIASGTLASGVGYAIWYAALRSLSSFRAATLQLSVPILASLAGVLILDEPLTARLVLTSLAVLSGIGLVLSAGHSARA